MWNDILDIGIDSLLDSLKVLGFAFIIYVLFSFLEGKVSVLLKKHKKTSPAFGALTGLIPQCGVSVIASDLYIKQHISMGCLVSVFFACSDEALPILLTPQNGDYSKMLYILPLLLIKLIGGFSIGFLTDLCIRREYTEEKLEDTHVGCCHHHIEEEKNHMLFQHVLHPLLHSLKIFIYAFIVTFVFGLIIYFVGGIEVFQEFLKKNYWLSPLLAACIGLIPNCASSVLTTELFLLGGIPFGALVTALCVNAGLGVVYLLKNKKNLKDVGIILGILLTSSIAFGYITVLIETVL